MGRRKEEKRRGQPSVSHPSLIQFPALSPIFHTRLNLHVNGNRYFGMVLDRNGKGEKFDEYSNSNFVPRPSTRRFYLTAVEKNRKLEKNSPIFLHGCEIKSGRGSPGYEVTVILCDSPLSSSVSFRRFLEEGFVWKVFHQVLLALEECHRKRTGVHKVLLASSQTQVTTVPFHSLSFTSRSPPFSFHTPNITPYLDHHCSIPYPYPYTQVTTVLFHTHISQHW